MRKLLAATALAVSLFGMSEAEAHQGAGLKNQSWNEQVVQETDCRARVTAKRLDRWNVGGDANNLTYFHGQSKITLTYLNLETDELRTFEKRWGWRTSGYWGQGTESWTSRRWVNHSCFDKVGWVVYKVTWRVVHSHRS
jgi:hypothetical protein